jgi:outer membrane lipoprotein-sorting protein
MKHIALLIAILISIPLAATTPSADTILQEMDKNMITNSSKATTRMVVHSRRASRSMEAISYSMGNEKAFTEYLAPPRERGTKMLKLGNDLWIYDPSSDRTIQISGNMLKQSVMGSDLSYEDMMEETSYTESYSAKILESVTYEGREAWILELEATSENVSYQRRKTWVDKERYVPLYEEWYAKSGKLLKTFTASEYQKISGRWQPMKILFKDELKEGKGTEYIIDSLELDIRIPEHIFSRASLRK